MQPQEIAKLPSAARAAVADSVAMGVSRIYWLCAAVMVIGLFFALSLKELPLRQRAGLSDAMENSAG